MKKRLIILSSILFIIITVLYGGKLYIEFFINSRLPKYLNSNPERIYDIKYEEIDYSIYNNKLTIKKLSFVPLKIETATVFDDWNPYSAVSH